MSDFDEEAERERLREQYERDKRKREATEQMSDLLLKGATMTNSHCGQCGDPIFRHDGQEFCPTCERVVAGDGEQAAGEAETTDDAEADEVTDGTATADAGDERTATDATPDADATASADRNETAADSPTANASTPDASDGTSGAAAVETPSDESPVEPEQTPQHRRVPSVSADATTPRPARADASLAEADASLVRTITRFARQAEASDDPAECRAQLATVEQAADALAAVRHAER